MWPTPILIMEINVGCIVEKLMWTIVIGLFSVVATLPVH